jgi:DNA-binding NarL/FixJ family response regulator
MKALSFGMYGQDAMASVWNLNALGALRSGHAPAHGGSQRRGGTAAGEHRVVDLEAAGENHRDIAQTLFVTPKTVEVHLSNAHRTLGIRSSRELPTALAQS